MKDIPLEVLTKRLFKLNIAVDKLQADSTKIKDKIQEKYNSRNEFNRWRNSVEGKLWKQQKHEEQNKCCAICTKLIPLRGSHIDHIKPLSKYPKLVLELSNLQVTCSDCNTSKNNSD